MISSDDARSRLTQIKPAFPWPGNPGLPYGVERVGGTRSEGRVGGRQGLRNVAGSVSVADHPRAVLSGKRILLGDDVMTTVATVAAGTRTLQRAGVSVVDVLTIARVVRTHSG